MVSINRWSKDIVSTPSERWPWVKQLVINQLEWLAEGDNDKHLVNAFGDKYRDYLVPSLIRMAGKTPLPDLMRFAIADSPVLTFDYQTQTYKPGDPVQVAIEAASVEIKQVTQNRSSLGYVAREHWPENVNMFDFLFEEVFAVMERGAIGMILSACEKIESPAVSRGADPVLAEIERVSSQIHRTSMRGPATAVLMSNWSAADLPIQVDDDASALHCGIGRVGRLLDKWDVYIDPLFPDKKILMFRNGPDPVDVGAVTSLYYFPLHKVDDENLGVWTRGAQQLLNPSFYGLVRIDD